MKQNNKNTNYIYIKEKRLIITSVVVSIVLSQLLFIIFNKTFQNFEVIGFGKRIVVFIFYIVSLYGSAIGLTSLTLWLLEKFKPKI